MKTAVAIETQDGERIALTPDMPADLYSRGGVAKVIWEDGSWSWGKCWYHTIDRNSLAYNPAKAGKVCIIGAGAYGNMTVWQERASANA